MLLNFNLTLMDNTYVQTADAGLPITVTVTRSGIIGSITSAPVAAIIQLAFSTTVQGSITASSPAIRYQVVLAQNGTLVINLTSPGGSTALPNNGADVQWFNSSGTRIGGTTGGFSFPYTSSDLVLNAGTYFIEVTGRGGIGQTGLYNIRVDYFTSEAANNTTLANAQVLVPGLTVRGSITTSKTVGIFRYNLTEPGRLAVTVSSASSANGGLYDSYVRWINANGTDLISRVNTYLNPNSYTRYVDLEAGTYYIEITPYGSYTGTYNLRGDFTPAKRTNTKPNNTLQNAQLLSFGQAVSGFISHQDKVDNYRYVLTQSGRLTMNVTSATSNNGGVYDVYVRWRNSDGTQINYVNPVIGSNPYNSFMDLEAGTYYIEITPYGSYTGTYNLSGDFSASGRTNTKPNDSRTNAQLLTSGQSVKCFMSHQEKIDMFRVVLTQSRRLTVNLTWDTGGVQDVWVRWLDVDGNQIRRTNLFSSIRSDFMDLQAGTYFIEITPYSSSATGTYNLSASW